MNSKIALSGLSILAALALMGSATFAYFSSAAESTNNVFAAGTLVLQLDDVDDEPASTITASFSSANLVPGGSSTGYISLDNGGSIDIAEIKFGANQTNNTNGEDGSNLADVLNLTVKTGGNSTCNDGTAEDHTSAINAALGGGGELTLSKLNGTDYDSLPGVDAGDTRYLCVTFTMISTAGDSYQGDSITENFVFEAHQDTSQ